MSETENNKPEDQDPKAAGDDAPQGGDETPQGESGGGETTPEEAIAQLTAELDSMRDKLLRALAEAENTRRRAEKEVRDTRDYAVSSFAKDMLDVADNLSRAVAAVDEAALADAPDAVKNLVEGVAMTEKAMLSKMERHGVKKVDPQPATPSIRTATRRSPRFPRISPMDASPR